MPKAMSTASIEFEIHSLLAHHHALDLAADALIKKYENKKLKLSDFESLATFLLYSGFYATLTDLILRKLDDGSQIPWGHFADALLLSSDHVPLDVQKAVLAGARVQRALDHLSRSHSLDELSSELVQQRMLRRQRLKEKIFQKRSELLKELEVLRSQGLKAEEEKVIQRLEKMFPGNADIYKLRVDLRERMAQDFMHKQKQASKTNVLVPAFEVRDSEEEQILVEIEKAMQEALLNSQALAADFALAQLFWENPDSALRILENSSPDEQTDWLRAEVLLRARRFVELLEFLVELEQKYSADAETIFAVHYLRAQALWGLQEKSGAIEILEGMTAARPHYRAAMSLLREWKQDMA